MISAAMSSGLARTAALICAMAWLLGGDGLGERLVGDGEAQLRVDRSAASRTWGSTWCLRGSAVLVSDRV